MTAGDARFAGRTATEPAALLEQSRARRAVDGAVDAAAPEQRGVRRVDDRLHVQPGDVVAHEQDALGHDPQRLRASSETPKTPRNVSTARLKMRSGSASCTRRPSQKAPRPTTVSASDAPSSGHVSNP